MIFNYKLNGIPCQIEVMYYSSFRDSVRYGTGYGDVTAPEPEEFEFVILDRKGYKANWLEKYCTPVVKADILRTFKQLTNEGD